MRILYCRIGWAECYNGNIMDIPKNGGSFNNDDIGHEFYNFSCYNGKYYGFFQLNGTNIHIDRISKEEADEYIDNVLVIWLATNPKNGGTRIVGWYKNARVYKNIQKVPYNVFEQREHKYDKKGNRYDDFFICSNNASIILPVEKRNKIISKMGQQSIWYGDDETNKEVLKYIDNYDIFQEDLIEKIDNLLEIKEGFEKETIIKARVNQSNYRDNLIKMYGKCCICGISNKELLIASHIKPWNKSNSIEKTNPYNGLLLCALHDKLFDKGFISISDKGEILISDKLNYTDKILSNISNKKIEIDKNSLPFIKYHRDNIFKK